MFTGDQGARGTLRGSHRTAPFPNVPIAEPSAPAGVKLCAVALVANECDIVESFARHTLAFADRLHVRFHNSYDTSRQIVERLAAEGLPVSFDVATTTAYAREKLGNELARDVAAGGGCDYLLPLDADEFIVAESRGDLEAELVGAPSNGALSLAWLTFVPTEGDDGADRNPATRIRHRLRSPHPNHRKVFFAARLLEGQDVYLADGNHRLLSRSGREIPERASDRVFLAHYPVRSAEQLASKIVIGASARRLSPEFTGNQSRHWRSLLAEGSVATDMPAALLSRIAMRYLDCKEDELVDEPIATSARSLRYVDLIRVNAFERLSAFVTAAFAEREARAASGASGDPSPEELRGELEKARHLVQHLHADLRSAELRASEKVRAARRKSRNRVLTAIGAAALLLAAATLAYVRH